MKKILCLSCIAFIFSSTAYAQYNQGWFISHQRAGALLPTKVVKMMTNRDHLYVLATVQGEIMNDEDMALLKYDMQGNLIWEQFYDVPGNYNDEPADMDFDEIGNIYVTGSSAPPGSDVAIDFCTIKYSQQGDELWVQRWGTPRHGEEPCGIEVRNGLVFVSGKSVHTAGFATGEDYHSKIYNSVSGKEIWSHSWNGPGGDWRNYPADMTLDNGNNLIVVGRSEHPSYDYGIIRYKWDTILPKKPTDSIKIVLVFDWERWFNGSGNDVDYGMFVTTNDAGDIYVTGESWSKTSQQDITTVKYDKFGNKKWDRSLNGTKNQRDQPIGIFVDSKDNVIVTGWLGNLKSNEDFCTIKYNPVGDTLWTTAWWNMSGETSKPVSSGIDKDDNIFLFGTSGKANEAYIRRLNPDGQLTWEKTIKTPEGSYLVGEMRKMHVDENGNLYVAGINFFAAGGPKMFLTNFIKQ